MSRISEVLVSPERLNFTPPLVDPRLVLAGLCQGSRHHSPTPLVARPHIPSQVLGSGLVDDETWLLCGTCWDNLCVYLSVLTAYNGGAPLQVRRDFGNGVRAIGDRVWADHLKRSLAIVLS